MASSLIVGMGQIGNGLFKVLLGKVPVIARDITATQIVGEVDIMHICIPYSVKFEKAVKDYIKLYNPKLTIVYSTVPIGTCERLKVVHSPVEGKHPELAKSLLSMQRWLGSSDKEMLKVAKNFWEKIVPVRAMPKADFTEWLKLRSTAKYGVNIAWADYEAEVSKKLGMDFSAIRQFDTDYNLLYDKLEMTQFKRYILDAPNGKIGGHCIVPNAKLLDEQYPNDWLKKIIKMEKK